MPLLTHPLANGHTIQLHLSRRAKKNIILRAHSEHSLRLSIPPQLSLSELRRWLQHSETALQQMLRHSPAPSAAPSHLWLYGQPHQLQSHAQAAIQIQPGRILLPAAASTGDLSAHPNTWPTMFACTNSATCATPITAPPFGQQSNNTPRIEPLPLLGSNSTAAIYSCWAKTIFR